MMNAQLSMVIATTFLLGGAVLLTACNTTAGAGRDMSATGKALTSSAEKQKP